METFIAKLWAVISLPELSDPKHTEKMSVFAKITQNYPQEDAYDVFLEHGLVEEAFSHLHQQTETGDAMVRTSLFFQMMTYLLDNKLLGRYGDRLSRLVPEDFRMAEFCNMYTINQSVEMGREPVFVKNENELSVGDLKSFLGKIL